MRSLALAPLLALLGAGSASALTPPTATPPPLASTTAPAIIPFLTPLPADPTIPLPFDDSDGAEYPFHIPLLHRRQNSGGGCPANFGNCAGLGAPQACCRADATCTPDGANHVACCPTSASCFGTLGAVGGGTAAGTTVAAGPTTLPAPGATGTVATGQGVIVSVGTGARRGGVEGWGVVVMGWGLWVGALVGVL